MNTWYEEYDKSYKERIEQAEKDLAELKLEHGRLASVGQTTAIVGDFFDGMEFNRIITIGDQIFSKYGDHGKVTAFDMTEFEKTSNFIDIAVTFVTSDDVEKTLTVDRLN